MSKIQLIIAEAIRQYRTTGLISAAISYLYDQGWDDSDIDFFLEKILPKHLN